VDAPVHPDSSRVPFPPYRRSCSERFALRYRLHLHSTLFTGTIAKVASLVAIVIGGYGFAHGEPGAKKALAGVAAGTGIAVLAANVLTWLWGV